MGRHTRGQAGLSLIELLIALTMLAVGMAGIAILVVTAMLNDNRNKLDTTSTMLSQRILTTIANQPPNLPTVLNVADCTSPAPQNWGVSTVGANAPGAGATLVGATAPTAFSTLQPGDIDWTQTYEAVPANYKMLYRACDGFDYEVRWNIRNLPGCAVAATCYNTEVAVSTRMRSAAHVAAGLRQLHYGTPVTLRTVVGR